MSFSYGITVSYDTEKILLYIAGLQEFNAPTSNGTQSNSHFKYNTVR